MKDMPAEIRSMFDDDEIAEIKGNKIRLGGETERDTIELAVAWAENVAKMDLDRTLPSSDRTVWTEHDLAGALFLRDHLEKSLSQLGPSLRDRMQRYIVGSDDRYLSYTMDDPRHRIIKVAEVEVSGRSWWWFRVPTSGPIAEDLAKY